MNSSTKVALDLRQAIRDLQEKSFVTPSELSSNIDFDEELAVLMRGGMATLTNEHLWQLAEAFKTVVVQRNILADIVPGAEAFGDDIKDIYLFGVVLKLFRTNAGLTISRLGELSGYSKGNLKSQEDFALKPPKRHDILRSIAQALNMPLKWMLIATGKYREDAIENQYSADFLRMTYEHDWGRKQWQDFNKRFKVDYLKTTDTQKPGRKK